MRLVWAVCDTYSAFWAVQGSFSPRGAVSFDTYSVILAVQVSFSPRGEVSFDTYCGVCGRLVSKKAAIGYPMTAGSADQAAVRSEPVTLFIISFSVSS